MKTTSTPTPPSPTPLKMSKANFPWSSSRKVQNDDTLDNQTTLKTEENRGKQDTINHPLNDIISDDNHKSLASSTARRRRKLQAIAVSRIRSVLTALNINKSSPSTFPNLGSCPKVIGTLFGYRKGHVHFVFQREHNSAPVFFIELATQITHLVKEMASGLVRIALECDKDDQQEQEKSQQLSSQEHEKKKKVRRKRLLEEQVWRTYCNGKKCGFANKREIGPNEAKILKAVEPISMGAGVLPGFNGSGSGSEGELMYMRAQFERVVGSRDSEAFYMMNPDCHGAPELSIYLLRV
ncbi:protein MIZU-KUSSEI 1-like [Chenopodium quinoa]|uniref:protein MIZU-KUSSEI 1-like n=1 Tax=Chenopodium quinoa TaxID=63459 RepID=UPI000B794176|nr:protein MIZU-KUSSEI 1-like [Chenopodium quinoa]